MNQDRAEQFIGKHLLFGLTYVDHSGKVTGQAQFHGDITGVDGRGCIIVRLHGSAEEFTPPPDFDNLKEAPEGEYRLRSTGEVVVNPDYLSWWTIHRPATGEE